MIRSFVKMTIEYILLICEKTGVAVASFFAATVKRARFAFDDLFGDVIKSAVEQIQTLKSIDGGFIGVVKFLTSKLKSAFSGKNTASRIVNFAMPFLAAAAVLFIATSFNNVTLAYEMKYSGRTVGYAVDEETAVKALDIAKSKVNGNATMTEKPQITVTLVSQDRISSADTLSKNIISTSSEVYSGVGVYVNDEFIFAVESSDTLDNVLSYVQNSAKSATGSNDVQILDVIETASGLFCEGDFVDENGAAQQLVSGAINVKTVKTEKISEVIKHKSVTAKDNTKPIGYRRVVVKGEDGERRKTVQTVYVNGKEQESKVVKTEIVKSAVDEQIIIGTRKVSKAVAVAENERLTWPVNGGYISQYFGAFDTDVNGHTGLDIAASNGTQIYSASVGTVTEVIYSNSGYGNRLKVNCGNGIVLLYAHCSEIDVSVGDTVNVGDMIAKVGSTGNSTGPHLHFEVRKNGAKVDPAPYLGLK